MITTSEMVEVMGRYGEKQVVRKKSIVIKMDRKL